MRRAFLLKALFFGATIVGLASAEDFVPFVIPAKVNPQSPMLLSGDPIGPDRASDRLVVHNGHFYRGAQRERLWGVNLSFAANWPSRENARLVAARLAAAGLNAVRCHHMDTSRYPRGLWKASDGKTLEPRALAGLDYFIDQMARQGIYVNLNLHVGHAHSRALGLPEANRQYDKIASIFTPDLIEAQKTFARQMLARVNPYRGVRYADDPAIAIVEITNENSLFMWSAEDTLRTLPPYYQEILQGRYGAWLREKYGSSAKLRSAWSQGAVSLGENMLANHDFALFAASAKTPREWHLEEHAGNRALASRQTFKSQNALRIEAQPVNETDWHLQFKQNDLVMEAGQYYTVTIQAAAETSRKLTCNISQNHEPWSNLGLSRALELTENWQTFQLGFSARSGNDNARLTISFGGDNTAFYLANLQVQPGGRTGLHQDESLEKGNISLYAQGEAQQRVLDRMRFLAETEKAYFDDMRNFIKHDLGCKSLVTGTIVFGPLGMYAQSDMDFIDAHAYWQHPRFPGRPWDANNWLIEQKPMTDYFDQATLFRLAGERMAHKPFTVTEYNHPAPLDSQAECVPMIASFAAAQDWDGVWLYSYSHSNDKWDKGYYTSYFDIYANPGKWGFVPAGAAAFRLGGIAPLAHAQPIQLPNTRDTLTDLAELHLKHGSNMFAILADRAKITPTDMLAKQHYCSYTKLPGKIDLSPAGARTRFTWTGSDEQQGLYAITSAGARVYTGHAGQFASNSGGKARIEAPAFAALTITPLDRRSLAQSRKILVTACGRCENTGMNFSEDRRTVGRNWGGSPVRIEAVTGSIELPPGRWRCQALDPNGMARQTVPVENRYNKTVLKISPEFKSMWYLLTR